MRLARSWRSLKRSRGISRRILSLRPLFLRRLSSAGHERICGGAPYNDVRNLSVGTDEAWLYRASWLHRARNGEGRAENVRIMGRSAHGSKHSGSGAAWYRVDGGGRFVACLARPGQWSNTEDNQPGHIGRTQPEDI